MCCHLVRERRNSKHPALGIRVQSSPGWDCPQNPARRGATKPLQMALKESCSTQGAQIRGRKALRHKSQSSALLFSPTGSSSSCTSPGAAQRSLEPRCDRTLNHRECCSCCSTRNFSGLSALFFKNEEIFLLQLCFQHSTWTEW